MSLLDLTTSLTPRAPGPNDVDGQHSSVLAIPWLFLASPVGYGLLQSLSFGDSPFSRTQLLPYMVSASDLFSGLRTVAPCVIGPFEPTS